ncbi:MAG: DUF4252 domain-containing protein [Bacteroidia bacterium]|nr:DUF4252 domain-containing protein [Bacteroidia bacterium]
MKKILALICALLTAVVLMAQEPEKISVEDFFDKYSGAPGTESTLLNGGTLKVLASKKGVSKTTAKLLKSLDRIWAISATSDNEEFLEDARMTTMSRKDYQLISNTSREGAQASFYVSEKSPKSLILISTSYARYSYMEIRGEFNILDFGSLSEIGIR